MTVVRSSDSLMCLQTPSPDNDEDSQSETDELATLKILDFDLTADGSHVNRFVLEKHLVNLFCFQNYYCVYEQNFPPLYKREKIPSAELALCRLAVNLK